MRVKTFYRVLRLLSAVVLFFFIWTFGPVWQAVAFAAANAKTDVKAQTRKPEAGKQKAAERFEGVLAEMREKVARAGEKQAKGEDESTEREALRAGRASIDQISEELRAEFSSTEKRLKTAGLPKTILARHADFVAHFEKNVKELHDNLDGIESAKTKAGRGAKIEKARLHLEKVKAPSKHQKLDPNNLPFRARKAGKTREPRLRKDEFERDFPKQHKTVKMAGLQTIFAAYGHEGVRIKNKPVQLAFNGPDSDILFSLGVETLTPQLAFADASPFLLAQATIQPSADDLSETPDVQFTDAISAKAQELGGKPLKIYEWVRNNIEYAPTYGSSQGADQCLQSKICNDMDTASLLIALLRVSGIYSHYEYSTIEIPIEQAMNWVGGVTDPKMAGTILATNGIPAKMLLSGGTYKAVQLEHVYVSAFIDYIPSRGAVHRQGDTWIPLDASYKQYTYTQGIDIGSAVPFDAQSFANQILSTATTNTTDGSVTNVNSALVQQTMQGYQMQVQSYIQQNYPNATVGDVIGKKEIIKQEYPYLMGTLPYKTVQIGAEFAEIPGNFRATMSFSIPDQTGMGTGLSYSTSLPQIAGKKITLSFSPATANDQKVIESLLPTPHPDGTPIQPSELPSSFSAYLINLKPELRIDGQVVATGASSMMGKEQSFTMSLNEPGFGMNNINNIVQAGEYYGIGVDIGRMGNLSRLKAKLETTKAKLETQNYTDLTKEEIVGDLLYTTIASYFAELDMNDEIMARLMNVVRYRAPSVGMFSLSLDVRCVFSIPTSAGPKGMMMDVDRTMQAVFSKDGNMDKVKQYMFASGSMSSALEHGVPEQLYSTSDVPVQGLSAVKALKIANDQGIPLYKITQANISNIMPQLQLDALTKSDIVNAVNAGKEVTISKTNITFGDWIGCGYIISDPVTGAGAYMISGGANGAILLTLLQLLKSIFFLVGLGASLMGASFLAAFILPALLALFVSWMGSQIFHDFSWPLEISGLLTGLGLDIFTGILLNQFLGASLFLPLAATPLGVIVVACLVIFTVVALTMLYIVYLPERRIYYAMGGDDEKRILN